MQDLLNGKDFEIILDESDEIVNTLDNILEDEDLLGDDTFEIVEDEDNMGVFEVENGNGFFDDDGVFNLEVDFGTPCDDPDIDTTDLGLEGIDDLAYIDNEEFEADSDEVDDGIDMSLVDDDINRLAQLSDAELSDLIESGELSSMLGLDPDTDDLIDI